MRIVVKTVVNAYSGYKKKAMKTLCFQGFLNGAGNRT